MVQKLTIAWLVALLAARSAMAGPPRRELPAPPAADASMKIVKRLAPPLGCNRLTIADGLPNSNVTAIAQDARGFLWFGTQDGLARYDGTRMTVYRPNKDPHSVSSGYITSLALDSSGKLWIGTSEYGVNLYDPETDRFERIGGGERGLTSEGVTAIVRDAKNRIWFAMGDGGLNRYDTATKAITAYLAKPLDVPITAIDSDREGNLWLGTAGGTVLRWNPDDDKATVSFRPNADSARATSITAILARSSGQVWIGTDSDGLYPWIRRPSRSPGTAPTPATGARSATTTSPSCARIDTTPCGSAPRTGSTRWRTRGGWFATSTTPTTPTTR